MPDSNLKSKAEEFERRATGKMGRVRLLCDAANEPFEVYAVGKDDGQKPRGWRSRICYPVWRQTGTAPKERIPWTVESLQDFLQTTLRRYRNAYGGDWYLDIREPQRLKAPLERPRQRVPHPHLPSVPKVTANEIGKEAHDVGADEAWEFG